MPSKDSLLDSTDDQDPSLSATGLGQDEAPTPGAAPASSNPKDDSLLDGSMSYGDDDDNDPAALASAAAASLSQAAASIAPASRQASIRSAAAPPSFTTSAALSRQASHTSQAPSATGPSQPKLQPEMSGISSLSGSLRSSAAPTAAPPAPQGVEDGDPGGSSLLLSSSGSIRSSRGAPASAPAPTPPAAPSVQMSGSSLHSAAPSRQVSRPPSRTLSIPRSVAPQPPARSPAPDASYADSDLVGDDDGGRGGGSPTYSADSFAADGDGGSGGGGLMQRAESQSQRSQRSKASTYTPPSHTPVNEGDEDGDRSYDQDGGAATPPAAPRSYTNSASARSLQRQGSQGDGEPYMSRQTSSRSAARPPLPPQRDLYDDDDENGSYPASPAPQPPPGSGGRQGSSRNGSERGSYDGSQRGATLGPRSTRPMSASRGQPHTRASNSGSLGGGGSVSSSFASPMATRQRPASAGRGARELNELMSYHPSTWDPKDVCVWVDYIGLGQYRSRFAHNCIDGRMLLRLTDQTLKQELGIGPLGHRQALMDAIATVAAEAAEDEGGDSGGDSSPTRRTRDRPFSARQEYPRRPVSASVLPPDGYLGPALGKFTVYEQRAKLLFELDRAQQRANQHRALVDQLKHTADLSKDEVANLRGLIQDLEHKNKLAVQFTSGGVDRDARVPWAPVGKGTKVPARQPHMIARPGEDPSLDELFKPHNTPSAASRRILQDNYGDGKTSKFLDRLQNDHKKRERNKVEVDRKYYSRDAVFNDPMLTKREMMKDLEFLAQEFAQRFHVQLGDTENEYNEQINEVFDNYGDDLKVEPGQLRSILKLTGPKKVAAAASAIKTKMFMDRYTSDLKGKTHRSKALEKKWWEQSGAGGPGGGAAGKAAIDTAQAIEYFGLLGWREEEEEDALCDARLDALLRRARAYKEKYDGWKERLRHSPGEVGDFVCDISWDRPPFAGDNLQALMVTEMQRAQTALERSSAGAVRPGSAAPVKTRHAPADGTVAVLPLVEAGLDYLMYTIKLLAGQRYDDIEHLERDLQGKVKRLAVYRAVRTQKFLEFTEADIRERERKMQEVYTGLRQPKVVLAPQAMDGFFERLLEDGYKRQEKRNRLIQDKMTKEAAILQSSQMYTKQRPRSAR